MSYHRDAPNELMYSSPTSSRTTIAIAIHRSTGSLKISEWGCKGTLQSDGLSLASTHYVWGSHCCSIFSEPLEWTPIFREANNKEVPWPTQNSTVHMPSAVGFWDHPVLQVVLVYNGFIVNADISYHTCDWSIKQLGMRRIIIACDGTGQSASRGDNTVPTNVTRFCRALSNSSDAPQIIFYQSGVGTQDLGWGMGMVIQAIGSGLEDNVTDGYTFLMNNYLPGDKIFIFGFSRGAFAARVLANIVARLGILRKTYSWAFKDAMSAFGDGKFNNNVRFFKKVPPNGGNPEVDESIPWAYDVEIEVVGCWDTVASLGVPWLPITKPAGLSGRYKYYDDNLVKGIKNAFHALALDEYRGPFTPRLWYLSKDLENSINLKQCWFPGVHTNVGGGYRALANITLAWMIDLCRPFLAFDKKYLCGIVKLDRDPGEWHKNHKDNQEEHGKGGFDVTYDGWGRGMSYDSYGEGETWTWKYRTPGAYRGVTNETIHASARVRWNTSRVNGLKTGPPVWDPKALKGFKPMPTETETETANGNVVRQWVKEESRGFWTLGACEEPLAIPEARFPIETHFPKNDELPSFEQMLRYDVPAESVIAGD